MIDASYSKTSAEFLANLHKKTKEDNEHDLQEMK